MPLSTHFVDMARNNAWSNERLLSACLGLDDAEFAATRTSFFPSLQRTLNHNLAVDRYYLDALEGHSTYPDGAEDEILHASAAELHTAQRAEDSRLLGFCRGLTDERLGDIVVIDRGPAGLFREAVGATLAHLFVHQIHHRGQAHAMLAGTRVPPPQLDEFFLAGDAPRRAGELAALRI